MPTVKTRDFKYQGLSGEEMHFRAPITVDSTGEFTVNIPPELASTAESLSTQPIWKGRVQVDHARVNWRIQGRVLSEIEAFVDASMKEHLSCEVHQELVIRYRFENNTVFARAKDGSLHPNGHFAKHDGENDSQRSWAWEGNSKFSATNKPKLFGMGVVAHVYMKQTFSRPNSSKVKYTNDLPGSHFDENPMRRLNGFIVGEPDKDIHSYILSSDVSEMPYSDAAANFFSDLMLAMCKLGEQLQDFVGDKANLELAIARGAGLLVAPDGQIQAGS